MCISEISQILETKQKRN